jgi:hypothetical protein
VKRLVVLFAQLVGVLLPCHRVAQVGLEGPIFGRSPTFVSTRHVHLCRSACISEGLSVAEYVRRIPVFRICLREEDIQKTDEVCLVACSIALW